MGGLSYKQTVKCTCITLYNCTLQCTIRTRAQSVRRQQRKRTSVESEMVTYNHVTKVVRNKCFNHQARRVGNTYPHCNFCWGFNNFNYQTNSHKNCSSNKQTKQIKLYTFHLASVYPWQLKREHLSIFEDICMLYLYTV